MVYQDIQNDYNDNSPAEMAVALTKVDWTTLERQDAGYYDKDFGAGYFDDFDIAFDFRFSDVEAGGAFSRMMLKLFQLCNAIAVDPNDLLTASANQDGANDDVFWIRLQQRTGGGVDFNSNSGNLAINTTYYCRLRRSGTVIDFDIYSSVGLRKAGAAGDVAALGDGGAGDTTDYRFCMLPVATNSGIDPNDHSTGWIDYVDLNFGGSPIGSISLIATKMGLI